MEKPEGWVKSEGLGGLESWGKPGKSEEADGAEAANGRKDRARTEERNAFFDGRTGDDGGELQPLDAIEPLIEFLPEAMTRSEKPTAALKPSVIADILTNFRPLINGARGL